MIRSYIIIINSIQALIFYNKTVDSSQTSFYRSDKSKELFVGTGNNI